MYLIVSCNLLLYSNRYNCLLCRPRDVLPPHLLPTPSLTSSTTVISQQSTISSLRPPSPGEFFLDGVCLSAGGLRAMRALQGDGTSALNSLQGRKKRRPRFDGPFDKSAGTVQLSFTLFSFVTLMS